MFKKVFVAVLLLVLTGCSDDQQAAKSSQPTKAEAPTMALASSRAGTHQSAELNLVFFLDPNGRPCQMQDAILMEMVGELKGKVNIKYVKTTIAADRNLFYQYGVRALPTLLLADAEGNEIRRMPPGVKKAADVRALIQSSPRS